MGLYALCMFACLPNRPFLALSDLCLSVYNGRGGRCKKGQIKCDRLAFLDDTYEESWANQNSGNTK